MLQPSQLCVPSLSQRVEQHTARHSLSAATERWSSAVVATAATAIAVFCAGRCRVTHARVAGSSRTQRSRTSAARATATSMPMLQKLVIKRSESPDEKPEPGDLVVMHYEGKLEDGTIFDSSIYRGDPFRFNVGESKVIDGWDMLISTMAMGEKAKLIIPAEYAYGEVGVEGYIPPNATLSYDVEILDIGRPIEEDEDDEEEEEEVAPEAKLFWAKDPERAGGGGPGYAWQESPSGNEVRISVPLDMETRAKDVVADIRTFSIKCNIADKTVLDAELWGEVDMDESHWDFEGKDGKPFLLMTLAKLNKRKRWEALLKGQPAVINAGRKVDVVEADVLDVDAALDFANKATGEIIDTE